MVSPGRPSELEGLQFVNDGVLRSSNPIFGVQEYAFQAVSLAWNHQFLSLRQRISDNFTAIPPHNGSSLEALGLYDGSIQSGEYAEYDGQLDRVRAAAGRASSAEPGLCSCGAGISDICL